MSVVKRPSTTDRGPQTADDGRRTMDDRPRTADSGRRTTDREPRLRAPTPIRPAWVAGRRLLRNTPLILGVLILLVVLAAVVAPQSLAPYNPDERGPYLQEINGVPMAPPFPPSSKHPIGSDILSRDLLSRIIHGTRTTLWMALVVTVIRVGLGASLGWAAAWYPGEVRRYILLLMSASATLPSLLFAYLIIATIGPGRGLPVFFIGLGLTGWAAWTQLVYSGILRIQAQPYMDAAEALGSTTRYKIRHYLLPNLMPVTLPAAAQEIAAALLIVAELGFIGIYLGSARQIAFADLLSGEMPQLPIPEWGGMLAGTRLEVFRWWWLPIMPALAFLITIFGFNLLADGLRKHLDRE